MSTTASPSLSKRLVLGSLLWVALSLLVVGLVLNHLFKQHVEQQLHKELQLYLLQLAAQLDDEEPTLANFSIQLNDPRFNQPLGGMYWQISPLQSATPSYYSPSLWDEQLQLPSTQQSQWTRYTDAHLGPLYLLSQTISLTDEQTEQLYSYQLGVAAQQELLTQPLQRFSRMLWAALVLLGSGLLLGVWWQLGLALRPLRVLRQQLAWVHEGKAQHLAGSYPQEIQPLVSDFNSVLHSNAQIVERARTQAGNLAHAIKTPLSVLNNAAKNQQSALADLVVEQVHTAQQQVDYHLSRARRATAVKTLGQRTAVAPAIHSLGRLLAQAYHHKTVDLHYSALADPIYFKGDTQDLHEMLGNVLDNAFKWCAQSIQVQVDYKNQATQTGLCLCIDDDGPGLDSIQAKQVFKRGVRADEQQPGSGLGLAIVADLVAMYAGSIQATRSPLGGLRVCISLP